MLMSEFLAAVEDKAPPAPITELRHFEDRLGAELPDDYRDFLQECNGGYVGGAFWFNGPTPDGEDADAGVHHIGGFRSESYFSLVSAREAFDGLIPSDLLWIMDDPFGNAICLGVRGKYRGQVFFWDHEAEPDEGEWNGSVESAGNVSLLANSFTEFVAGLRPNEDED